MAGMKRSPVVAVLLALLLAASAGLAQTYPTRTVRIVVPSAPGGGLDLGARNISAPLSELWGQQVIVENRPGANFIVGTEAVAKANPDGYTLLVVSGSALTINPVAFARVPYSPSDLVPIVLLSGSPFALVVHPSVPANTVPELIAYLRANPGKLNHASNSATTTLASELFKALTGVTYVEINYKGAPLAVQATALGETQLCFADAVSAFAAVNTGRLRLIGFTGTQRRRSMPNVPSIAEAVPGYNASAGTMLMAPAKTPPEITARIATDVQQILKRPEIIARAEALGTEVINGSPAEAAALLKMQTAQWSKLIKERGLRFE
jgi:tripartite-type tricarboxylate transporter receptor subunit TctC